MSEQDQAVAIDATIVSETVDGVTRKMPSERAAARPAARPTGSTTRDSAVRSDRNTTSRSTMPSERSSARRASPGGGSSVRDQQRAAKGNRHANVTSSGGGGYRSAVSGGGGVKRGNTGKPVAWDSNGDGRVDLREVIAGVLRWIASVAASPNTYAIFFFSTGSVAGWYNAAAWIAAAYRTNHPIAVALIMWVGITGVECYHVLSTMTPRSAVAKLVRAARKPDLLPTLDSDYVSNANALSDDLQRQLHVKSNLPWFITSIFFLALETYIVADPETFMGPTGLDPLGCASTLFVVGGIYMSCVGYKFAINQTLSRLEQELVDRINETMEVVKTTKMS